MDVPLLWLHLVNVGYIVRKNGYDGLQMWQPFKELYSKYSSETFEISDKIKKLSNDLSYTHDETHEDVTIKISNSILTNSKEQDHFIIQHFRIPIMLDHKLPLVKLLQIAYNVGQAKAEFEKGTYSEEITSFYKKNNLSELSTFVYQNI